MPSRPLVIAHRGASACAPENTLAAFRLAAALGADGFETDLRVTADGHFVLLHDSRVNRTTNGRGRLDRMPLAAVRKLDAGSWFLSRPRGKFAGERIPTLDETLALAARLRLHLLLEIKAQLDDSLLRDLALRLRRARPAVSLIVLSFDADTLASLRRFAPRLEIALLTERPRGSVKRAVRAGAADLAPNHRRTTSRLVRRARHAGLGVLVWTVNRRKTMRRMLSFEVDAIMTDDPARLRALLD